jgi:transketolase
MRELLEAAARDSRISLLVGDLGYSVVEEFAQRFPRQFCNVGVAEQNMTGVAAGLALSGRVVFTYSIANFSTFRCLEQIRNDVCYHRANVKIVAVGGGFAYGPLGASHHATEDIAIMRALPNMVVIAPGDPVETAAATRAAIELPGPVYLRLGKAGEPVVHETPVDFRIGRSIRVREGSDVVIISTGGLLTTALGAAETLARSGVEARVLSMHTLQPIDDEAIRDAAHTAGLLVTVEEHNVVGGLGSAVAEILAETPERPRFRRFGTPSVFAPFAGDQLHLRTLYGLTPDAIALEVIALLERPVSR